jgi:hypothetical protein
MSFFRLLIWREMALIARMAGLAGIHSKGFLTRRIFSSSE